MADSASVRVAKVFQVVVAILKANGIPNQIPLSRISYICPRYPHDLSEVVGELRDL